MNIGKIKKKLNSLDNNNQLKTIGGVKPIPHLFDSKRETNTPHRLC